MAAEPVFVPVAICEMCWLIDHTDWEPESINEDGQIVMRLTGVDVPEKVNTECVDICAICGGITISGIYEMRDPSTVNYLAKDDAKLDSIDDDPTAFTFSLNDYEEPETETNEDL